MCKFWGCLPAWCALRAENVDKLNKTGYNLVMQINRVTLNNFRNYAAAEAQFFSGLNFVVGKNAQGKTNLLESIYLVSVGKSPKNSKDKQIIKFEQEKGRVEIDFNCLAGKKNISIILDKQNKKYIKINNLNILKLTELVGNLSVVYFSPDELKLIKEVPEDRRNFLDVSISQFNKVYLYNLIKYNKILKQRNAILKSNFSAESKTEQLALFTPQLVDCAADIILTRQKFVEQLAPIAKQIHLLITQDEDLSIAYSYGGANQTKQGVVADLTQQFARLAAKEIELGYTCLGPHRDDLIFSINGLDCRQFCSQGQQRTVALVLKLSLMEVIKNEIGEYPILLLDDVLSELDNTRQTRLLNLCTNFQTIITCTSLPTLSLPFHQLQILHGTIH